MIPSSIPLFWLGFISGFLALAIWQHFVSGRLMCIMMLFGHAWGVLKEEVLRPLRVIKKTISRKNVQLDEYERKISG